MNKNQKVEKKLTLKKLQMAKVTDLNSIKGGGGTNGINDTINDNTNNTDKTVNKTIQATVG